MKLLLLPLAVPVKMVVQLPLVPDRPAISNGYVALLVPVHAIRTSSTVRFVPRSNRTSSGLPLPAQREPFVKTPSMTFDGGKLACDPVPVAD